jgi:Helix-turn-helix domain
MSVKLMAMVFDDYPGPPLEKLTALAVADHADHDGGRIWPTVAALVAKTGHSERTIQRHLRQMEQRGWLELVKASNGRGSRSEYRIPIELLKGVTQTPFVTQERVTQQTPFTGTKGVNGDTEGCQRRHGRVSTETNIVCESPTEPSTEPPTPAQSSEIFDTTPAFITLTLNTGAEYPIHEPQIAEWRTLFPAVNARQELRAIRAWLLANPKRRKTRNGILRFVTSWLSRTQDRGGNGHATRQPADNSAIGQIRAANQRAREREAVERPPDAPGVGTAGHDVREPLEGELRR